MERARIISRSTGSHWADPLHMVKKPDLDEWRQCGDYRALNTRTITDSYVIPNLHSLNFQLKGKHVFSRLDLVKGYFKVPVNKASRAKTVVVTPFGTFQFNFMPFRLKNTATLQRLMDQIFGDLDFVFVYLDDILISSGTEEEHCRHLHEVFGCLSKAGLAINLPKSKFLPTNSSSSGTLSDVDTDVIRPSPKHVITLPRAQRKISPDSWAF